MQVSKPRVLLYAHCTTGLGHLVRQCAIASALKGRCPQASVMLVTGARCEVGDFIPMDIEYVKLPSWIGTIDGGTYHYAPASLEIGLDEVRTIRREILRAVLGSFRPHVVLVDHKPSGMLGELRGILLTAVNTRYESRWPRFVFGVRDILDDLPTGKPFWAKRGNRELLTRVYERILVYGDPRVFDFAKAYSLPPELSCKILYTGYVYPRGETRREDAPRQPGHMGDGKLVVASAGGGQDGARVLHTIIQAARLVTEKVKLSLWMVCGPHMASRDVERLRSDAQSEEWIRIERFIPNLPELARRADLFVGRAGYNTTLEVLTSSTPAIFVPRDYPQPEQLIRSRVFAERGWCTFIREGRLEPHRLARLMLESLHGGRSERKLDIKLDGATVAASEILGMLGQESSI